MRKGPLYFPESVEDLTAVEGFGDAEVDDGDSSNHLSSSGDESKAPPRSIPRVSQSASCKRKNEESIDSEELKRRLTTFVSVIQLLIDQVESKRSLKAEKVYAELTRMEVAETKGDEYFASTIEYLSDEKHADCFLALRNDNQRWIYLRLRGMD